MQTEHVTQSKPIEQSTCMRMREVSARRPSDHHTAYHNINIYGNPSIARYLQKSTENGPQPHPKSIKALPESYTNVPPVSLPANAAPTITDGQFTPASADIDEDQMQTGFIQEAAHQIREHSRVFEDYFREHFENIYMITFRR